MSFEMEMDVQDQCLHRYHQTLLDESFWCSIHDYGVESPLLLDELRQEAALRAWVRQLDTREMPPASIPDEAALRYIGQELDWKYGADEWWEWAIWSTCSMCMEYEQTLCPECIQLVKFTGLCDSNIAYPCVCTDCSLH